MWVWGGAGSARPAATEMILGVSCRERGTKGTLFVCVGNRSGRHTALHHGEVERGVSSPLC